MAKGKVRYGARWGSRAALGALLLCLVTPCDASRLPFERFTVEEGLPSDRVLSLSFDHRGFLWLGSSDGAARFDGREFTVYGRDGDERWGPVRAIRSGPDGSLWIADGSTLHVRRPGSIHDFETLRAADGGWRGTILDLLVDRGGRCWLATSAGVFVAATDAGSRFEPLQAIAPAPPIHTLAEAADGTVWIGSEDGAWSVDGGGARHLGTAEGLASPSVRAIAPLADGSAWIGTTGGLCVLPPADTSPARGCRPAGSGAASREWVMALTADGDSGLVAATNRGLYSLRAGRELVALDPQASLGRAEILALARDAAGDLWIGTAGGGLLRVARNGLTAYGQADGLLATRIASLARLEGEGIVAIATGHYFHRFDGHRFQGFSPRLPPEVDDLGWPWAQMWARDGKGRTWLATGRGVAVYPPGPGLTMVERSLPERLLGRREGLAGENVQRVFHDRNGMLWISTIDDPECTLTRYDPRSATAERFCIERGLPPNAAPTVFAESPSGSLWTGFFDGHLMRRRPGDREFEDLPTDRRSTGTIHALHFDRHGRLWIGTEAAGVLLLSDPDARQPALDQPLPPSALPATTVRCICEDRAGRIYLGTAAGIVRLGPNAGQRRWFTIADGLPNSFVDTCIRDADGQLWFGTFDGLARLLPQPELPLPLPRVFISSLVAGGKPVALSDVLVERVPLQVFEPSRREIEIHYSGPEFGTGGQLDFQYRLRPDDPWSAPRRRTSVLLAGMRPGTYHFAVRAINADGRISPRPAEVEFTILAPVWRRGWFLGLLLGALTVLFLALHRLRIGHMVALERQRTQIAMDLHDEIGAGLGSLALLSDMAGERAEKRSTLRRLVDEIGDAATELSTALDDIVGGLRPGADTLESLARDLAERGRLLFPGQETRFEARLPARWPTTRLGVVVRRNVFLIGLEALHNAARHADPRHVVLEFHSATRRCWVMRIEDDGRGLEASAPPRPAGGGGLTGMAHRATEIGARLEIDSAPNDGTRVRLTFALQPPRRLGFRRRASDDHRRDGPGAGS